MIWTILNVKYGREKIDIYLGYSIAERSRFAVRNGNACVYKGSRGRLGCVRVKREGTREVAGKWEEEKKKQSKWY